MHNIRLETERLILRPLSMEDADAVFQWVSDERVTRYMVYFTYTSVEQVREWLDSVIKSSSGWHFGFERKSDGLLIGSGNISSDRKFFDGGTGWGFGYNIRHDCRNNGYTTEAVKAMMKFAHDTFVAQKFHSIHAEPNKASGRVMEKCGLHFVGYGEFSKYDGSCKMRSMIYEGDYSL